MQTVRSPSAVRPLLRITLFACIIAACSSPDAPVAPVLSADDMRISAWTSYMDPGGTRITVVDEVDGTEYVLDVAGQQILFSDGRVLLLDAEQTDSALATFHGIVASDEVANELAALPPPPKDDCFDPECPPEPLSTGGTSETSSSIVWRTVSEGDKINRGWRGKHFGQNRQTTAGAVSIMSSGDPCTDIANAALPARLEYKSNRSNFFQNVWEYAAAATADWKIRVVPRGSFSAAILGSKMADNLHARTSMSVLAFMWNSHACGSRSVTAGPVIRAGSGGSGGSGGTLQCKWVDMEIQFAPDGPWYPVSVYVCEYV